jgi:hypothetical protein
MRFAGEKGGGGDSGDERAVASFNKLGFVGFPLMWRILSSSEWCMKLISLAAISFVSAPPRSGVREPLARHDTTKQKGVQRPRRGATHHRDN